MKLIIEYQLLRFMTKQFSLESYSFIVVYTSVEPTNGDTNDSDKFF